MTAYTRGQKVRIVAPISWEGESLTGKLGTVTGKSLEMYRVRFEGDHHTYRFYENEIEAGEA